MAVLRQLIEPGSYRACDWDLKLDARGRRYWIDLFCEHIEVMVPEILEEYPDTSAEKIEQFRREYLAEIRAIDTDAERFDRIDILVLDEVRSAVQRRYGFDDPYRALKARENRAALAMLPELLSELDGMAPEAEAEALAAGLMAGNIFDLGARVAIEHYQSLGSDFRAARAALPPRPWYIDDYDAWCRRWDTNDAYEHVAFFVDNAGSDVCLGCLPLVRWMVRKGARVTVVANEGPALNDVLVDELRPVLDEVAQVDIQTGFALKHDRLKVVGSGGWAPLLDLTDLDPGCVDALADADLIWLHGMGRALESSAHARFSCGSVRSAVLKDAAVAERVGGRLFDCVFRFAPGV